MFARYILVGINYITPVKVSDDEEHRGLDISIHGENAYDIDLM